jgi:hypothetical protein
MEWETSMGHLDKVFQGWEPTSAPDFGPQAALATYLACAKRTEAATQQALQQLCSELGGASAAGEDGGRDGTAGKVLFRYQTSPKTFGWTFFGAYTATQLDGLL